MVKSHILVNHIGSSFNPAVSMAKLRYGITTARLRTFRLRHFVYRHFVYRYFVYYDYPNILAEIEAGVMKRILYQ